MTDIICDCGCDAHEHYRGGCFVCGSSCKKDEHEVYRAHIAKQDAVIEAARQWRYSAITTEELMKAIDAAFPEEE